MSPRLLPLSAALLATLPVTLFAQQSLPPVCTKTQFDPWACYWLEGRITEGMCGDTLKPDIPRIQAAAETGNAAAAYRLGQLYANATWGVERDYGNAHHWLKRAAQGGNRDGQIELARLYEFGRGVTRDLQQALYWYEQAVKQGPYKGIETKVEDLRGRLQESQD